jgi:hypothetical protein
VLSGGAREIVWEPPPQLRSGFLWIGLRAGGRAIVQRTLLIR